MKKFFFFAAALVAAVTINAETYDFATYATEADWVVTSATKNATESKEDKLVYDIQGGVEAVVSPKGAENIQFTIKNGSDKKKAFNINLGNSFEFGGKNGIIKLSGVQVGASIKLVVAAKGGTAADFKDPAAEPTYPKGAIAVSTDLTCPAKGSGAEGADEKGYVWKTLEYQATSSNVEIKEFAAGYRIKSLTIGGETAINNTNAETVKATKYMENGQLIIEKNGVKYNALGAVIAE